jgi:uncharacterized membrane protein
VDVTTYEALLFAHLLFVAAWVGGDIMLQVLNLRIQGAGSQRQVDFMSDIEWLGTRLLTPAAALVVVFGVVMVIDQDAWKFSQFWVSAGLAVFLASFIAGAGFLGPESGRIGRLAQERGSDDPEVSRRIGRVIWISRIELLLLILVILDMIVKPGL